MMSTAIASPRAFKADAAFLRGLGRAFAGALIFALPMLMTMEMWQLGFYMDPLRLALLLALTIPTLVGLSRFGGLRPTARLRDDVADALVVLLVAALAATVTLYIFGILAPGMSAREMIGKIVLQTVPGSFGAMLARSQLGGEPEGEREKDPPTYWGELFLMGAGALFLSFLQVVAGREMLTVAGDDDDADIIVADRIGQGRVHLIQQDRAFGVPHFRPVMGDPGNGALDGVFDLCIGQCLSPTRRSCSLGTGLRRA